MGAVHKLSVDLEEDMAGQIDAAVASGDYASPEDVIGEALAAWKRQREAEIDRLREIWRVGIESGEPVEGGFDVEDIVRRGRERLEARRRAG